MFWFDHNMGWWGYAGMGAGMVLFWALDPKFEEKLVISWGCI